MINLLYDKKNRPCLSTNRMYLQLQNSHKTLTTSAYPVTHSLKRLSLWVVKLTTFCLSKHNIPNNQIPDD